MGQTKKEIPRMLDTKKRLVMTKVLNYGPKDLRKDLITYKKKSQNDYYFHCISSLC